MRRFPLSRSALAVSAVALALFVANASAECPIGCTEFTQTLDGECSTRSFLGSSSYASPCFGHAMYDVPTGTMFAKVIANFCQYEAKVSFDEDFVAAGPTGDAFTVQPRLHVTFDGGHGPAAAAMSIARLSYGPSSAQWTLYWPESGPRDTTLTLPAFVVANGVTFRMSYSMESAGDGASGGTYVSGGITGTLDFDMGPSPPGGITSCRGYTQGAVPAERSTWGRIKSTFR